MRFLRSILACVTLAGVSVSLPEVSAATYQIDATGDNDFQLYVSKKGSSTSTALSATSFISIGNTISAAPADVLQPDWYTPSRYTNVDLAAGDVISVYVHNTPSDNSVVTNPSAIIARIRETDVGGSLKIGGESYSTDEKWLCAWRHENAGGVTDYDQSRLTGDPDDWTAANLNVATATWATIGTQTGSDKFEPAIKLKQLGETSIWSDNDDSAIKFGLGYTGIIQPDTPYWIYGNNQIHSGTEVAHHGWCRFTIPGTGGAPVGGGSGDPVFTGFQGQVYQFHGLPDEHFNLVSSPQVQLNAHFVYLSSGKCDYNDTQCYTHPGTYMDVLGFTIAETRVKLVAGTHEAGLRVWINDVELPRGSRNFSLSEKTQASIKFDKYGKVQIRTEIMDFEVSNSDMFMNVGVALMNQELLRVGSKKHTITDKAICKHNEESYNHEYVESKVTEKYPISTPLHGLIGQTWRNLKICGREWMGTVQDYVVSSLFGTDYHYKYFQY